MEGLPDVLILTESTKETVEGYLRKCIIYNNQKGELKLEIVKVHFELNVKDKTLRVPIGHIEDAIKIGKKLKKRRFEDLTLIFNDEEIKISEI